MNSFSTEPSLPGKIGDWPPSRSLGGFSVGILCIDSHYPIIPGNVQHAETFRLPVLYGIVRGVTIPALLAGDPAIEAPLILAGQQLIQQGVSAIVGACGSFANYQSVAARAFGIPTCMSILTQVPHLLAMLGPSKKLAIYFAVQSAFTERVRQECGISTADVERLVLAQAIDLPAFRDFSARPSVLDARALANQLEEHARALRRTHPDIGAVVLQCSDLPPFASVVRRAFDTPVFDATLLVELLGAAARQRPHTPY